MGGSLLVVPRATAKEAAKKQDRVQPAAATKSSYLICLYAQGSLEPSDYFKRAKTKYTQDVGTTKSHVSSEAGKRNKIDGMMEGSRGAFYPWGTSDLR